jgi:hypothetical protein
LDWRPELLIYHMGHGAAKRTYAKARKESSFCLSVFEALLREFFAARGKRGRTSYSAAFAANASITAMFGSSSAGRACLDCR